MKTIKDATAIVGGQAKLAKMIGVTPPTVYQWLKGARPVPATRCIAVEDATNGVVTRHDLRSDVFGQAPQKDGVAKHKRRKVAYRGEEKKVEQ